MRRIACALMTALGLLLVLVTSPAAQAATVEVNVGRKVDALKEGIVCRDAGPTQGGISVDPHYSGQFRLRGDVFCITDSRADGKAGVLRWRFLAKTGAVRYSTTPRREGMCLNTSGSKRGYRTAVCNKDLPERGALVMWAGARNVSGSTRDRDVTYGDYLCVYLEGGARRIDEDCLLIPSAPLRKPGR